MKICTKCGEMKPFESFYKRAGSSASRRSHCISCTLIAEQRIRENSTYQQRYHKQNRERIVERKNTARTRIEIRATAIVGQAKRRARNAKLEFDIPIAAVEVLLRIGICQKSGIPFVLEKHQTLRIHPFSPSLDRKDAFKGYTMDNVQLVCDMYNRGKGQNTDSDFISFCKTVAEFNK